MNKSILAIALLTVTTAQAGEVSNEIAKSCYARMPNVETAKLCVNIQTNAAKYLAASMGSGTEDERVLNKCASLMPFPGDWLFTKICYDTAIHSLLFGAERNH